MSRAFPIPDMFNVAIACTDTYLTTKKTLISTFGISIAYAWRFLTDQETSFPINLLFMKDGWMTFMPYRIKKDVMLGRNWSAVCIIAV
tara:strand:+ start:64 stop:327 length:264 start_codon:yes stop_codon:yes gene_type:complete